MYLYVRRLIKSKAFLSNLLIALISIFYLLNVKGGHDWGGDFSMYIMNANNLVRGMPYAQTGYIYNVDVAFYGPAAYPPVFPLMLAPFISIWGINLQILKLPGIFCFIGFLFYFNNKILPKSLSPFSKIILIICIGLYPFYFSLSESILSDFPFLLFSFIALNRINNQPAYAGMNPKYLSQCLLTGLWIYLACGTRSVGLILLPVAFLFSLIQNKKITLSLMVTLLVPLLLILLQGLLIPQTGAYFDQVQKSLPELISVIAKSLAYYFVQFVFIFPFKNFYIMVVIFFIMFAGFVPGVKIHMRKGVSSFDLFFLLYFGLILIWPSYQSLRLLIPIIPLYFLYILEAFDTLIGLIKLPWLKKTIGYLLLSGIVVYYAFTYMALFPRPITDMEKKETRELFQFIQTDTNTDDVILFFKPRVLALYSQRKSVAMAVPAPNGDTLTRMQELNVSIVVVRKNYKTEFQPELSQFISTHPGDFELIYENPEFQVFKKIGLNGQDKTDELLYPKRFHFLRFYPESLEV